MKRFNPAGLHAAKPMTPLPYLSPCRVSGDDAGAFLQAQLAADVASLGAGEAMFAAYCSPRGQVIGLLLVQHRGSDWLLAGHSRLMADIVQRLRRFVLRARVEILDPAGMLAGLAGDPAPPAGMETLAPRGTGLRYAFGDCAAADAAAAAWRWDEVRSGILWLQPETSERFLPQMLGLDRIGAVSFTKGCYPGQEVIARARYLGRVKRRPVWLEISGNHAPEPGANCVLQMAGSTVEGTIADVASAAGRRTLVVTVAPLEAAAAIAAIEFDGAVVAAQRLDPPAA